MLLKRRIFTNMSDDNMKGELVIESVDDENFTHVQKVKESFERIKIDVSENFIKQMLYRMKKDPDNLWGICQNLCCFVNADYKSKKIENFFYPPQVSGYLLSFAKMDFGTANNAFQKYIPKDIEISEYDRIFCHIQKNPLVKFHPIKKKDEKKIKTKKNKKFEIER